jgi:membrane protease subunit (stomatin/prohibitin family)
MEILNRIKYDFTKGEIFVQKFERDDIRLGSQLIVDQAQEAIFVKGGVALDIFVPGTYTLSTGNLPLLNGLVKLPFGGNTPFTAEIWFINKTVKRDLTWGTRGPIQVIDPIYNFPISIRAHGTWGMRIEDSRSFITQIVGTMKSVDSDLIESYFIGEIMQRLTSTIGKYMVEQSGSIFQASARLNDLSRLAFEDMKAEFNRFGIEVINFNIQHISIPDEEQRKFQDVLGKRMEIDQISKAQVGPAYLTKRTFDTLEKAAENPSGAAGSLLSGGLGLGMGIGAGVPLGQQLSQSLTPQPGESGPQKDAGNAVARLKQLKEMREADLITQEEYETKKKQIIDSL